MYSCISTTSPPHPHPRFPWLPLLAFPGVRRCYLFSDSPLCYLVMKRSAASIIPRCQFPFFLAALGWSTVSTPKSTGELLVDPSVASNTFTQSTQHWGQLFSSRPRPGFTPPAIVPNITQWVSRSMPVRCPAAAQREAVVCGWLSQRLHIVSSWDPRRMTCGGRCAVGPESQWS